MKITAHTLRTITIRGLIVACLAAAVYLETATCDANNLNETSLRGSVPAYRGEHVFSAYTPTDTLSTIWALVPVIGDAEPLVTGEEISQFAADAPGALLTWFQDGSNVVSCLGVLLLVLYACRLTKVIVGLMRTIENATEEENGLRVQMDAAGKAELAALNESANMKLDRLMEDVQIADGPVRVTTAFRSMDDEPVGEADDFERVLEVIQGIAEDTRSATSNAPEAATRTVEAR